MLAAGFADADVILTQPLGEDVGDAIQMRSRIKLNKANFKPEDYSTLRDFFAFIVKKHGEQIVFKKKKT